MIYIYICNKRRMRSEFKGNSCFFMTLLLSSRRQEFSHFSPRCGTPAGQGEGNTAILFCVLSYDSARRMAVALAARVSGRGQRRRPQHHRRCPAAAPLRTQHPHRFHVGCLNTAFTSCSRLSADSPAEKSPSKTGRGFPETPSGPLAEELLETFTVKGHL